MEETDDNTTTEQTDTEYSDITTDDLEIHDAWTIDVLNTERYPFEIKLDCDGYCLYAEGCEGEYMMSYQKLGDNGYCIESYVEHSVYDLLDAFEELQEEKVDEIKNK